MFVEIAYCSAIGTHMAEFYRDKDNPVLECVRLSCSDVGSGPGCHKDLT